ncbi:phage tail fiber protein [Escherichia coli]|uniref:phage tail fiber protein n=1 Tax=Escherichia coli TaxID=562 RepID=UPI0003AB4F97|nr:phage tail fiber protein [Escherichia coli]EFM1506819.1 phage tail fiber protein [Escherichia coli]EKI5919701.1 phage tail fiber protein [Escherichia coli]ELN3771125.1 phage tail fiber protein [Escherichia coli]MBB7095731.1 phage tail fiber protein [Escherichia coli]MCL8448261.1 phage tail fiber protein [Escherichia coli]
MSTKFKTVITTAGAAKLAAATAPGGRKVNITTMAVGDGGGKLPVPDAGQTGLIHEVWRHALNKISQDKRNSNYIIAELVIPPEVGGFWMRELGLYDDAGTLIAVANMAESYKPALAEGSGRSQTCRMVIIVSSVASVELTIDTTTVMATQDYVDDKIAEHEQSRRHPDASLTAKGFTQLSSATNSTSETLAATPKAVKAAYDLANGKYTAQDATTARKGLVQLSSATNSTSETLAATPKAVKAAYDLANGKYTAQDATTARKGLVQLSSATNSDSENLAATPKAVKSAYDNAEKRLQKDQNGADIPGKDTFTKNIGACRAYSGALSTEAGNWTTAQFIEWLDSRGAFNHPYWMCKGSWSYANNKIITDTGCGDIHLAGCVVEVMGTKSAITIRVTTPTTSSGGGTTSAQFTYINHGDGYSPGWRRDWNRQGDSMTGTINQDGGSQNAYMSTALCSGTRGGKKYLRKFRGGEGDTIWHETVQGGVVRWATGNTDAQEELSLSSAYGLRSRGEITSLSANGLRIAYGNYGFFIRNDGSSTYFMLTKSGDRLGTYNNLRPLIINDATGAVSMGHGLSVTGDIVSSTKVRAGSGKKFTVSSSNTSTKEAAFNLWGNSSRPVVAELGDDAGWHFYSQRNTDNSITFAVNGQVSPSNYSNFDSRYVRDIRLGTRVVQTMQKGVMYEKAGHVITGLGIVGEVDGDDPAVFRPIQKYINGTWYNVAQV